MNKKQLMKYLEDECHDFLNYKEPQEKDGEYYKGFYIELENVAEIILKMNKNIKNPEIKHFLDDDGRYLCIKACGITPQKVAKSQFEVSCKNCRQIMEREYEKRYAEI